MNSKHSISDFAPYMPMSQEKCQRNLIVIDDQMIEVGSDNRIVNLFTKGSHHRNLSVIYIVQNVFHRKKAVVALV